MLQQLREADAHFERIHSLLILGGGTVATVGDRHAAAVHDGVMVVAVALEGIAELGGGRRGCEIVVEVGGVRERHGGVSEK